MATKDELIARATATEADRNEVFLQSQTLREETFNEWLANKDIVVPDNETLVVIAQQLNEQEQDITALYAHNHDDAYATKESEHTHDNKDVLDGITDAKVSEWNNKSNFSGSYLNLTDKPTIPTKVSELTNDSNFVDNTHNHDDRYASIDTQHTHDNKVVLDGITSEKVSSWDSKSEFSGNYNDLQNLPVIPSKNSQLINDSNYINVDHIDGKNIYKRKVVKQFVAKFADYDEIIENQNVSYIYPQSFFIDEQAGELLVLYSPDWASVNNQRWVVVYDWESTNYKTCFQCGNAAGEGIVVRYVGVQRLLYVRTSADNYHLGEYDITQMPINKSSISPINTYDVGLYANFAYSDGRWYIEQIGPALGSYNRRNLVGVFDESFNKVGEIYFNSESIGYFNNSYTEKISKKQGFTVHQGKFIFGCGGIIFAEDERTYYSDYGIRVCDMHGNHVESGLVTAHGLMDALVRVGINSTRIENEGVFSTGDKLYSLCMNVGLADSDSERGGIIIFEEFAKEDYIDCSSFCADDVTINKTIYETKIFPRSYNGYIYNPLTGARFTDVEQLMDFMIDLDLSQLQFYQNSTPLTWFGEEMSSKYFFIQIYNLNNGSFTIVRQDSSTTERYWIYGTTGSRTINLIYSTKDLQDRIAELEEVVTDLTKRLEALE